MIYQWQSEQLKLINKVNCGLRKRSNWIFNIQGSFHPSSSREQSGLKSARKILSASNRGVFLLFICKTETTLSGTIHCRLKADTISSLRFLVENSLNNTSSTGVEQRTVVKSVGKKAWRFTVTQEQWVMSSLRSHSHRFLISPHSPAIIMLLPANELRCTIFHKLEDKWIQAGNVTKPREWPPRVGETWTLWMKKWSQDCAMRLNLTNFMFCLI